MTDGVAARNFCGNFGRIEDFYEDLETLCCHHIPTELASLGYEIEEGKNAQKAKKANRLLCSQAISRSRDAPGKYLPDPTFVRFRCDGKPRILVAALLSPSRAPAGEPALLVVAHSSPYTKAELLVEFLMRILRNKTANVETEYVTEAFFVPLRDFGRSSNKTAQTLSSNIREKIVQPLKELLKGGE